MEENLIPERTEKEETADNKTVGGEKKFGRLKAIGYTLLMILLFYLIQFAITVPIIIVYAFQYIAGIDAPIDMQSFIASITENGLITIVTAVSTVATTLVFALWYYFKYGRLQKRSLPELWGNAFGVKKTILYIVGSLFCYFMASNTISGIDLISPSSVDAYTEMMQQISSGSQGLLLLAVVILAPIGEECLFRGLVFQRFRKYFTIVAAWILQAVFFGIFHMNIVQGIYVIFIGLFCGYAAYKAESVLPAIFLHLVYNAVPFVIQVLPEAVLLNTVFWLLTPFLLLLIGLFLFRMFGFSFSLRKVSADVSDAVRQ